MGRWLVGVTLASAVGATGCVHGPTVRLDHAELNGVQLAAFPPRLGVLLTVVVGITNPNAFDVGVRAMRGEVVLAGRYRIPVDFRPQAPGLWLRAGAETQVRMPVDVPVEVAAAILREAFASPVIPFQATGVVDVTGSSTFKVDRDNFPYDLRGTVTRQQIEGVVPAMFLPR